LLLKAVGIVPYAFVVRIEGFVFVLLARLVQVPKLASMVP
jgi:hypothetical protein